MIYFQSCTGQGKSSYNSKAIELNNEGVRLMQRSEYDSALTLFNRAVEIDNSYYLPYSNIADVYLIRKQFDKALEASEKIIEIKPDLAEGWTFAGILYDRQGDSLTAIHYYNKSIELFDERIKDPEKKEQKIANRINRAFSLMLLGEEKEGKDELRKIKADSPENLMIDEFLNLSRQDCIKLLLDPK